MIDNQNTLLLGAHLSIAGGLHRAIDRARLLGCTVVQIFTHNPRQWKMSKPDKEDRELFLEKRGALLVAVHANYLINLLSADNEIREKSRRLLVSELMRCEEYQIPLLILHPGSIGKLDEQSAIRQFAGTIDEVIGEADNKATTILLETVAGHKFHIGNRFEHLRDIIGFSGHQEKLGICFDTCHVFASGYDLATEEAWNHTIEEFGKTIGLDRLLFFHLNDSLKQKGSHIDRHTHIGKGYIGETGFSLIMNDARFFRIGKCIETPKGDNDEFDRMNLSVLRGLVKKRG